MSESGVHQLLGAVQEESYEGVTSLCEGGLLPCSLLVTNAQGDHALNVLMKANTGGTAYRDALRALIKIAPRVLFEVRDSDNRTPLQIGTATGVDASILEPFSEIAAPDITVEDRKVVEERDWALLATILKSATDEASIRRWTLFTDDRGANATVIACSCAASQKPLSDELKYCCLRLLEATPPALLLLRTYFNDPVIHSVINSGDVDLVDAALKVLPPDAFGQDDMCKASPLSSAFFSRNRAVTLKLIDAMDTEDIIIAGFEGEPPLKAAVQHSRDSVVVSKILDRLEHEMDPGEIAEALILLVDLYISSGQADEMKAVFERVMGIVRREWHLDGWTKRGIRAAARSALRQRAETLIQIIDENAPLNELFVIPGIETIFHEAARDWDSAFLEYLLTRFPPDLLMVQANKPTIRRGELADEQEEISLPFLPLHVAIRRTPPDDELIKLIIDNMSDEGLEFRDNAGNTLLHHAARSTSFMALSELLARVPHLKTAKNGKGQTPYELSTTRDVATMLAPMAKRA